MQLAHGQTGPVAPPAAPFTGTRKNGRCAVKLTA